MNEDVKNNETENIQIDPIDLKIIELLSKGVRNKNLDQYLFLSNSAIEKRKSA